MKLKFANQERTHASMNGVSFALSGPEEWGSIVDVPTRDAVLKWLAEGNTPEPVDPVDPAIAIQGQIDRLERDSMLNRGSRELEIFLMEERAAQVASSKGVPAEIVLGANVYYVKLKALDQQISALREKLQ